MSNQRGRRPSSSLPHLAHTHVANVTVAVLAAQTLLMHVRRRHFRSSTVLPHAYKHSPVQRLSSRCAQGWRRVLSDERRVGCNEGRPAATSVATPRGARRWDMAGLGSVGERGIQLCLQVRLAVVAVAWLPSVTFGRQRRTPSRPRSHSLLRVHRAKPEVVDVGRAGLEAARRGRLSDLGGCRHDLRVCPSERAGGPTLGLDQ